MFLFLIANVFWQYISRHIHFQGLSKCYEQCKMSNQTFVVRKPLYNERVRLVCRRDDSITVAISDQKNKTFDTSAVQTRYNGSIILLKLKENFRGHQRNISYLVSEGQLS